MIDTILFDLDGTLLPMDEKQFIQRYFSSIRARFASQPVDAERLVKTIWGGTDKMVINDGSLTNEQVFWDHFLNSFSGDIAQWTQRFEAYYREDFKKVKASTKQDPLAKKCVEVLKQKGYQLVLATNPIFPRIATLQRVEWAGLDGDDFLRMTTYENSCYCKPNLQYYQMILNQLGKTVDQCLMIGNDAKEDMIVKELGMQAYLVTNCLNNKTGLNLDSMQKGSMEDLYQYLLQLPQCSRG